ncbi:Cyclic di-GMP phosphodiesterase response regulator RpfG [Bhargavaea cecembensis DSE10]|uniref:Cyclic di-GMP phosphodiesterase response regulator RpfG n=1 Tax=Bhargavaea cecembensis DSE10 TaxID=1235279 RepID=M7NF12_9BACL|nr:HD-GYP domain-containing protein [Bhargavaea cecembensis]EMR07153.1 Cyclic di-GMP phosphodiesterase response regulator RpfG [Bhargavaea cecembensis DSE10]
MTSRLLNRWVSNPKSARLGFWGLLMFSVLINSITLQADNQVFILYIFTVIFLGIGYSDKPKRVLFILTALVVTCRYFLIPDGGSGLLAYLLHFLTYYLITLISAGLIRYAQRVREDNLELTTALSNALDSRDPYTLNHSMNVAKYALLIAEQMELSKEECDIIRQGALLHDIGKIGVPEQILLKKGRLTDEEYEIIQSHPTIGYDMIKHVGEFSQNGVLDIVLHHHERFDGKGYPKRLKGHEIPLFARIVAVADTYDAMTSKRVYRDALDQNTALNEIRKGKGTQFDPEIADVFDEVIRSAGHRKSNA